MNKKNLTTTILVGFIFMGMIILFSLGQTSMISASFKRLVFISTGLEMNMAASVATNLAHNSNLDPLDQNSEVPASHSSDVVASRSPDFTANVTPSLSNTVKPLLSATPIHIVTFESPRVLIPVLNYHSINEEPGNISVLSAEKFAQQMLYLSDHGYEPLTLDNFFLILEKKKQPPLKPILLTFDDGYSDNYLTAMPILIKHGFPATLFMSPGSVGSAGYLNWQQVKEMKAANWDIQPHGMTHPHLPQLSAIEQEKEIIEARTQIETELGSKADIFCYPYGEFNQKTINILEKTGFRYAFTINQGKTDDTQPSLKLKRIFVNGSESLRTWSSRL